MAVETGDKITRRYENFRGVDFRSNECSLNRSPDALNVWRNYNELTGIETRPAMKHLTNAQQEIVSVQFFGDRLFYVEAGGRVNHLKIKADGTADDIYDDVIHVGANAKLFHFDGSIYALGDTLYTKLDGAGVDEYFIPTTSIGALPDGTGRKMHQDVNLLTPCRINTFHTNEDVQTQIQFHLDTQNVNKSMPNIEIDGEKIFGGASPLEQVENTEGKYVSWIFDPGNEIDPESTKQIIHLFYEDGVVVVMGQEFKKPKTAGVDNISIKFSKTIKDNGRNDTNLKKILGCTIVEEFDNRIFLSGNPDYPNIVFHSGLSNPMYFSDLDVYEDGKDDGKIRAMVAGNGALWVFRDTNNGNAVYYHTAAFDATYGKVYPSVQSNIPIGCVGGAINFLDDIVFFSQQGMESVSQNIEAEQFATHKSSLVDIKMVDTSEYRNMVLAEWQGYLLVCMGTDVYLADSRAVHAVENHYEYEWYHWSLGKYKINCATVKDGVLYIGTDGFVDDEIPEGNIYTLKINDLIKDIHADGETEIESYWTTPKDKFASPNKVKTTNKKGCVIEAKGDVALSTKVESTGFEEVGCYTGVEDHFVSRIKRKKFKDIQLKFCSKTKFRLESVTLEAFIGSYIKQ